jgi:hypothetical protein
MTGRFEHFDARPGGSYRLVRADAPTLVRAGSPPSAPTWSTPWEVAPSTPDHALTSGPTMCATGSTLQITRRDCRPRWTISPLPLNAGFLAATVLVAMATIRVVATEGQIYGRQLQQAGDYTGPHRDPLAGHRDRSPTGCGRTEMLPADSRSGRDVAAEPRAAAHYRFAREATARRWARRKESPGLERWSPHQALSPEASPDFLLFHPSWTRAASLRQVERGPSRHRPELEPFNTG